MQLMHQCYGIRDNEQYQIPYEMGLLPAYRFTPHQPKATLILFGGYDSSKYGTKACKEGAGKGFMRITTFQL